MESLILVGATLIDGTGAEPVRGRAVVVEQGRIAQVVDTSRAPRGRRIDLEGHTLLPGLINCHVHLCLGAEADPVRALKEEPAALTALKALRRAQETVEAGVTTVRDLGGREYVELAVRRAITEGHFPGPRILAAGRPICMTGGHGNFLGREAGGPDDARKAGREQLKAGAHAHKPLRPRGGTCPWRPARIGGRPSIPTAACCPSSSSWSSTACPPSRRYARRPPWPRRRSASRTRPAASRPAWPPTSWRWRGRPPSASTRSR